MRLIDADLLKDSLRNLEARGTNIKYVKGLQDAIDDYFPQIIDNMPTIDAEPVKHAYWIDLSEEYTDCDENVEIVKRFKCSSCGNKETTKSDYCRRCGAKMDGGAEDA